LHIGCVNRIQVNSNADWTIFGRGYDKVASFKARSRIRRRSSREEELYIQAEDALASVRVIEAAYKSVKPKLWTVLWSKGRDRQLD